MDASLEYDGQTVRWLPGGPTFKATSGGLGHQTPAEQCLKDQGPVPEGTYVLQVRMDPRVYARDDGKGNCKLSPAWSIQRLPRGGDATLGPAGTTAGMCEPNWANWGWHRVRIEPATKATRQACGGDRSGFYLHDSTKGYSHGCIEVEGAFFALLEQLAHSGKQSRMQIKVSYKGQTSTSGGTRIPP